MRVKEMSFLEGTEVTCSHFSRFCVSSRRHFFLSSCNIKINQLELKLENSASKKPLTLAYHIAK